MEFYDVHQQTPQGRAQLRERVAVEHTLAPIGRWQGRRARYRGTRKNLFDLRRCAVVHNLPVLVRSQRISAELQDVACFLDRYSRFLFQLFAPITGKPQPQNDLQLRDLEMEDQMAAIVRLRHAVHECLDKEVQVQHPRAVLAQ